MYWQYIRVYALDDKKLNSLGSKGWELVTVTDRGMYVFKRPKVEPAKTPDPHHLRPGSYAGPG